MDIARRRLAAKRGAGAERLGLDKVDLAGPEDDEQLLNMNEPLIRFALLEPRRAELVRLRYFAGLTFEETAEILGIAVPTAKKWWAYASAWLRVEIKRTVKLAVFWIRAERPDWPLHP